MEDIVTIRRPIFIAKVKPFIDKPIVKVFTGIRRCGKSVMMHLVQSELKDNGIDESRIDEMAHHVAENEGLENAWIPLREKDIAEIFTASL